MELADLNALSSEELRQRCEDAGVSTDHMREKHELASALHAAVKEAEAAAEEEEEEAMRQAMLMSEESSEVLSSLSVGELKNRCAARGIDTRGFAEKREFVDALLGEELEISGVGVAIHAAPEPPSPTASESTGAVVIGKFAERFHMRAADESMLDPSCGKVVARPYAYTTLDGPGRGGVA